MEAAIRHLRDGALPDATACATCCVLDNLGVIGGALVLRHAIQSFIAAMRQGRGQATSVRLMDMTGALADATSKAASGQACRQLQAPQHRIPASDLEVIDMYSDPWGWRQAMASGNEHSGSASTAATPAPLANLGPLVGLEALRAVLLRPPQSDAAADAGSGAAPAPAPRPEGQPQLPSEAAGSSGQGSRHGGGGSTAGPDGACRSVCVVIGCLSTLMERYGEWQALALLEAVQRSPVVSCVLTSLHTDLHSERVVFGLRRVCSCTLELSPLTGLQAEVAQRAVAGAGGGCEAPLAGRVDCRTKRRTGRVKVESELYSVLLQPAAAAAAPAPTRLRFFPAPPSLDAPDPKSLVRVQQPAARAAPAAASAGGAEAPAGTSDAGGSQPGGSIGGVVTAGELARAVGSSMRLTLTEEERRAKQQVVLPYQHQGQHRGVMGGAYAAGDHRAYLPPAAGGTGPAAGGTGQQALGHILYVRDSASEADSDQDLDEDLDI